MIIHTIVIIIFTLVIIIIIITIVIMTMINFNVKVTSTAAAKMLNIFPRKGCIAEVIHNHDVGHGFGDYDDD